MKYPRLSRFTHHVLRYFPVFSLSRLLVFTIVATLFIAQSVSAQLVNIPDPNLERAIRETLNIPNNNSITHQEMLRLTSLRIESPDLKYLTGLKHATNLEHLSLGNVGMVSDLTPLSNLTSLQRLNVARNQISDIRPLAGLIYLRALVLHDNEIRDIPPLANLTNLIDLNLGGNHIDNLEPLTDLTRLQILHLSGNQITDITPLANLAGLTQLTVSHNQVSDVRPLAGLINLTFLNLRNNRINDLNPLANLTALETLRLDINAITDITPLTGLKNLTELRIANNPIHDFSPLVELEGVELDIEIDPSQLDKLNVIVEVPDPNLKQAVRDALSLPAGVSLTQGHMLQLIDLNALDSGITDLTGLEYATELGVLKLGENQIHDLRPLTNLVLLDTLFLWDNPIIDISPLANLTNLKLLDLGGEGLDIRITGEITDISPLANLTQLRVLDLRDNLIEDITPLANLKQLTLLVLVNNRIVDFSPLANLVNLRELYILQNFGTDITPLRGLNLTRFEYDEVCDFAPLLPSVRERIETRSFPSVFQPWGAGVVNRQDLSREAELALHDLYFSPFFDLKWETTVTEPTYGTATLLSGVLNRARNMRQQLLELNPNMVFLVQVDVHAHPTVEAFPPNSDLWLRDDNGQIIRGKGGSPFIDFLKPKVQDLLVKRIIAVERCGVFDGIMLDGFHGNGTNFGSRSVHTATNEEIIQAMLNIIRSVRSQARDDFLILMNTNHTKPTRYAEYVNGTFMEIGRDNPGGYSHGWLQELESTLSWAEENLREPRINCLRGGGLSSEPPDGPNNIRWLRLFMTLSLTHSNGYALHTTGQGDVLDRGHHAHLWHPFWDADLGFPVGLKTQLYQDIEGLFIREFTNGWAVYNRSGKIQTISLPESATGVSSRKSGITHVLPDLDGEIYLKAKNPADVNGDGKINILDLVQVANGFGKSTPDPNGDGQVNILDLVFVVQQFSQ